MTHISPSWNVEPIDLHFLDEPGLIGSYLIRKDDAVILVESGPGSTLPALLKGLETKGLQASDITHVLLTHIHLDHAGGAGWLAEQGATIYVHERGAKHMLDPSRLWSSATRVYGAEFMEYLWGEMRPVPKDRLVILQDEDTIDIAGIQFRALYTPGHASHHIAYIADGVCFTGDVAGCSLPGTEHTRMPTPPPDLDVELWFQSLRRLREAQPRELWLTHFGKQADPQKHLERCESELTDLVEFVRSHWAQKHSKEQIVEAYVRWMEDKARAEGIDAHGLVRYEHTVGSLATINGFMRYFRKQEEHLQTAQ